GGTETDACGREGDGPRTERDCVRGGAGGDRRVTDARLTGVAAADHAHRDHGEEEALHRFTVRVASIVRGLPATMCRGGRVDGISRPGLGQLERNTISVSAHLRSKRL